MSSTPTLADLLADLTPAAARAAYSAGNNAGRGMEITAADLEGLDVVLDHDGYDDYVGVYGDADGVILVGPLDGDGVGWGVVLNPEPTQTYYIGTDDGSGEWEASSEDAACQAWGAEHGAPEIECAQDLIDYVEGMGGYVSIGLVRRA